jgi:hypothetical protein
MPEWGDDDHPERDEHRRRDDEEEGPEEGYDADEQLRRALEQERHCAAARDFFERAPLFRIRFEEDGTVSLCKKRYAYWPTRPPATSTRWCAISNHADLEHAERRLRHVTSPPIYYDEHGRLAKKPRED